MALNGATATSGYTAEATALFAAMTGTPSAAQKAAYNTAIATMKASGAWAEFDIAYFLMGYHQDYGADTLLNIVNPATFTATLSATAPTYSFANRGWIAGTAGRFIATGWNPTGNGVKFTQNDNSIGVYCPNEATSDDSVFGNAVDPRCSIRIRAITGNTMGARNNNAITNSAEVSSSIGAFTSSRTASNAHRIYATLSGADVGLVGSDPYTSGTTGLTNAAFFIFTPAGSGTTTDTKHYISFAYAGGSLTAAQILSIYNAISTLNGAL